MAKRRLFRRKNVTSSRQTFLEGLSVEIKAPCRKGKRLIFTYIGSTNAFLIDGLLAFESIHTGNYHKDNNPVGFEDYFSEMITLIPVNSVIVLDNAPYHSRDVRNCLPPLGMKWKSFSFFRIKK